MTPEDEANSSSDLILGKGSGNPDSSADPTDSSPETTDSSADPTDSSPETTDSSPETTDETVAAEAVIAEAVGNPDSSFWLTIGSGLSAAGRALGRGAVVVGGSVADAYRALDPDLVRHLAQLPLMGLTYLTPGFPRIEALPDDGQRAVIFVHGLGGHRGNFLPMQCYFRVMGRRRCLAVGFREQDSIQTMADQLRLLMRQVIDVHGLPEAGSIDLVAHSMGGLIVRLALEDPSLARSVANVVTLGTPHAGTQLARLLRTTKVLELRVDSEVVARLRSQLPWPGPPALPRLVAVWSPADMLLMPPEAAQLEGAKNVKVDGFSHFSYLIHPQAWKLAFDLLEEPR